MATAADPRGQPAGFAALVGSGLTYAGYDQGVDFTGAGEVYAPSDAVVTRVVRRGSGWPGEGAVVNLRLTSGPRKGEYVYIAEDFAPITGLHVGQPLKKGSVVGHATGSGKAPGIEVGWAQPSGIPVAPLPPPRPANQQTPQGLDFRQWIATGAGGAGGGGGYFTDPFAPGHVFGNPFGKGGVASKDSAIPGVGAAISVGDFLGKLTDPSYILRGLQVIAGAVLVLVGVVLLVRQVALAVDAPDVLNAAADKVPAVAAAKEARAQSTAHRQGVTAGRRAGARREGRKQGMGEIASRERIETGPQPVYGKKRGTDTYGDVPY
jgi:hypothetical protein